MGIFPSPVEGGKCVGETGHVVGGNGTCEPGDRFAAMAHHLADQFLSGDGRGLPGGSSVTGAVEALHGSLAYQPVAHEGDRR